MNDGFLNSGGGAIQSNCILLGGLSANSRQQSIRYYSRRVMSKDAYGPRCKFSSFFLMSNDEEDETEIVFYYWQHRMRHDHDLFELRLDMNYDFKYVVNC